MFTLYFPLAMLVSYGLGTATWRLDTGLCKFVQNISTNVWSLGKRTGLKFAERSYLFISYNIIIFWLYTLNGFQIIFLLRDSATQELMAYFKQHFCVIITCGVFFTFQCFIKKFQLTCQLMKDLRSCLMHASRYKVSLSFGMLLWKPNFFNVWVHFLNHCQQECLSADL